MTIRLLRDSILVHQRALEEARAASRQDHELLHELGSTLAGITSATAAIRHDDGRLSGERRQRLEQMVAAELDRAQRLMLDRSPGRKADIISLAAERHTDHADHAGYTGHTGHTSGTAGPGAEADVNLVVDQLVLSHEARGLDVRWTTSGDPVAAVDADGLAEVVNILLDNAGRHGGRHGGDVTVWLEVHSRDGFVEITCGDNGPGIAPEVVGRLYESGVSGPDSDGSGLGLAIAHRFVTDAGGSLELINIPGWGATFVARLPEIARSAHVIRDHVA
jgi:signal transduction histidine kinase